MGNCNALNDLCSRVCVLNKTEYLKLNIFNMIPGVMNRKP